jgi:hypothetical protein
MLQSKPACCTKASPHTAPQPHGVMQQKMSEGSANVEWQVGASSSFLLLPRSRSIETDYRVIINGIIKLQKRSPNLKIKCKRAYTYMCAI